MNDKWKQGQGADQKKTEEAQKGVNKSAMENLKQGFANLKDAFTGSARANEKKENKPRGSGGYPGRN